MREVQTLDPKEENNKNINIKNRKEAPSGRNRNKSLEEIQASIPETEKRIKQKMLVTKTEIEFLVNYKYQLLLLDWWSGVISFPCDCQ